MIGDEKKQNCWEFLDCGREPDGHNIAACGVCPASIENRLDGIHGGRNAGRACWVVDNTMCKQRREETFAEKYKVCSLCDFYLLVRDEEKHDNLIPTFTLLKMLED